MMRKQLLDLFASLFVLVLYNNLTYVLLCYCARTHIMISAFSMSSQAGELFD